MISNFNERGTHQQRWHILCKICHLKTINLRERQPFIHVPVTVTFEQKYCDALCNNITATTGGNLTMMFALISTNKWPKLQWRNEKTEETENSESLN